MARSIKRTDLGDGNTHIVIDGNKYTQIEIGERLRDLRKSCKLTQDALATMVGITRSAVNGWEMGLAIPSTQYLIALSMIYKVSIDYLLGLDNSEFIDISHLNERDKEIIYTIIKKGEKPRISSKTEKNTDNK